jgi:hypothetical protein
LIGGFLGVGVVRGWSDYRIVRLSGGC